MIFIFSLPKSVLEFIELIVFISALGWLHSPHHHHPHTHLEIISKLLDIFQGDSGLNGREKSSLWEAPKKAK